MSSGWAPTPAAWGKCTGGLVCRDPERGRSGNLDSNSVLAPKHPTPPKGRGGGGGGGRGGKGGGGVPGARPPYSVLRAFSGLAPVNPALCWKPSPLFHGPRGNEGRGGRWSGARPPIVIYKHSPQHPPDRVRHLNRVSLPRSARGTGLKTPSSRFSGSNPRSASAFPPGPVILVQRHAHQHIVSLKSFLWGRGARETPFRGFSPPKIAKKRRFPLRFRVFPDLTRRPPPPSFHPSFLIGQMVS